MWQLRGADPLFFNRAAKLPRAGQWIKLESGGLE